MIRVRKHHHAAKYVEEIDVRGRNRYNIQSKDPITEISMGYLIQIKGYCFPPPYLFYFAPVKRQP